MQNICKKNLPINIGFKKLQFFTQHSHAIGYNRVIGFRFLESCLLLSQPKTTVKEKVICVRGSVVKFWIVWNKMNISPALMKDVLCIVTSMGLRNQTSNLWIPRSDALPLGTQNVFLCLTLMTRWTTSFFVSLLSSKFTNSFISIYKHYSIDIADPSHMQDACYMNFLIDLIHCGVSVAQW